MGTTAVLPFTFVDLQLSLLLTVLPVALEMTRDSSFPPPVRAFLPLSVTNNPERLFTVLSVQPSFLALVLLRDTEETRSAFLSYANSKLREVKPLLLLDTL